MTESPAQATAAGEPQAPRRAALAVLGEVLDRRQPLDTALESPAAGCAALPPRDRAFVRMAVATTLRRLGQIDDFIVRASGRAEAPEPCMLHNLLRLSATQIAFMAVPDYAVVDTAVSLAESCGLSRQKGFVNAVLRRIAENSRAWEGEQDALSLNIPSWLTESLTAGYGPRAAAEIAQASLSEAPLDITLKDPSQTDYWARELGASILPTGTLRRLSGGPVQDMPGFGDGMWWVQDAAAALPVRLFGDLRGRTAVDLCAAPGGKTMQMAAAGAQVLALDRSAPRLRRLRDNLRRLRLESAVRVETADAQAWRPAAPPEMILLDAPCTATGTARRRPDVLRLKTPSDLARLTEIQARLLDNAAAVLAPGGLLVYCTCSLSMEEGERQVERLLSRTPSLRRIPVAPSEIGGLEALLTPQGDIRVLPFHLAAHGGMDGFYAARLRRIS